VVRLTRHAKNRLGWVARRHPEVTADALLEARPGAKTVRYDDRGNRRARIDPDRGDEPHDRG
jgi:hypothetical protein